MVVHYRDVVLARIEKLGFQLKRSKNVLALARSTTFSGIFLGLYNNACLLARSHLESNRSLSV